MLRCCEMTINNYQLPNSYEILCNSNEFEKANQPKSRAKVCQNWQKKNNNAKI